VPGHTRTGERGAEDEPSPGRALPSGVPAPHPGPAQQAERAAGERVHWQSQTLPGTNRVQSPTSEPRQEQKETEPKTSNNKGPKSLLETGPKTNLKTSAKQQSLGAQAWA